MASAAPAATAAGRRRARGAGRDNTEKVKQKLDAYFAEGKFYEAQQLYHTLFNRLNARKNYSEAIPLMVEGTLSLLKHNQHNAGGDLALKLVDLWSASEQKVDDATLALIEQIFASFPKEDDDFSHRFMRAAIQYTAKIGAHKHGHPRLNKVFAESLSKAQDYAGAQRYWLRSEDPVSHAASLMSWCYKGTRRERDLFTARAVFQYLCLENIDGANKLYETSIQKFNALGEPLDSPLIQFVSFLLQTVEREAAPLFHLLREKYAVALQRDPEFGPLLDQIGHVYFGIEPPQGMLDGILKMFGGNSGS